MHRSVFLLLIVASTAVGCAPPGNDLHPPPGTVTLPPIEHAQGRLVSSRPVVVVTSPNWVPADERERWTFPHSAAFAVWVEQTPPQPLVVHLTVAVGDAASLRYRWDGDAMASRWIRRQSDATRLEVPADRLTPGVHALAVVRTTFDPGEGAKPALRFGDISWSLGELEERFDPHRPYRHFRIARFLLDGVVASRTTEQLGGILFDGPGSAVMPTNASSGAVLRTRVHNVSLRPATFRVDTGSTTVEQVVAPRDKATLAVPLDRGRNAVLLTVSGAATGLFLWGAPHIDPAKASSTVPIVLVTLDTTRRDVVPPYGGSDTLTPNLAALAARATVFERAVATAPWTLPSHASMFTGLYASHHLAGASLQALPSNVPTVAELLAAHGYVTAGFAGGFFCSSQFGISRGFMVYHDPEDWEIRGERLTDLVLGFLRGLGHATPFLFVNYFDAHEPYRAPPEFRARSGAERLTSGHAFSHPWDWIVGGRAGAWVEAVQHDIPYPPDALQALRAEYEAEVSFDDFQLGRLIEALRARHLYDRSLFVVVADHGELLGEHRLLDHGGRLDPELVEVPLLIKFPGQRTAGRVSELVSGLDLFPTLLEAAGIQPPANDGMSLAPRSRSRLSSRETVFSEEHQMGMHRSVGRLLVDTHVYSAESLRRRSVAWNSGEECFERRDGAWRPSACATPGSTMREVTATLGLPDLLEGGEGVELADSDMEKLRAIGYVR